MMHARRRFNRVTPGVRTACGVARSRGMPLLRLRSRRRCARRAAQIRRGGRRRGRAACRGVDGDAGSARGAYAARGYSKPA